MGFVRNPTNFSANFSSYACSVAVDNAPTSWRQQGAQNRQERALARAIVSLEGRHLAGSKNRVDPTQRHGRAEATRYTFDDDLLNARHLDAPSLAPPSRSSSLDT